MVRAMRRLLLVSTSTTHGTGYLDHCAAEAQARFDGCGRVLFVPFALHDQDGYAEKARERFAQMGLGLDSLHTVLDPHEAVAEARGFFIGGGNTFRLLKALLDLGVVDAIRRRCLEDGVPYMGTSAGSNVATRSIHTTNDMPILWPSTLDGLGLVPFNLNPHYLDPDPGSTHMGETRETRIREFHEEHDVAVLGLREGAMLKVDGDAAVLVGERGGRLFRRGEEAQEIAPGASLDHLLA